MEEILDSNPPAQRVLPGTATPYGHPMPVRRPPRRAPGRDLHDRPGPRVRGAADRLDLLAGDPDWSPDGTRIVFLTRPLLDFEEGPSVLFTMAPDGSAVTEIGATATDRRTQPRWSPDGGFILYTRVRPSGLPRHIWAIAADGSEDSPLLADAPIYTHPVLQPTP